MLAGRWCAVGMHVVPENVPECVYSCDLCCGWGGGGTGKSGLDGMQCVEEFIFKSEAGRRQERMPEFNGVSDEDGFGVLGEDAITSVVEKGRAQVEAFQGSEVPRASDSGFMMDKDVAASGAQGSSIEVVGAKEGMPCGWGLWC